MLGERMDVFEKTPPHCLYLPNGTEWEAKAETDCVLAVCSAPGHGGHAARWRSLSEMDRRDLRCEWMNVFGNPSPNYLSLNFMRKALIWQFQAVAIGDLKPSTRKFLDSYFAGRRNIAPKVTITPGAQLIREWNGRRYLVNATDQGFEFDGQDYPSLTAIAQKITGAKWSGPRFFGLHAKNRGR